MVVHPDSIPCFPASKLRFAMIGMTEKFGMHNWHSSDAQLLDEAKVPVARAALHWPSVGIPDTLRDSAVSLFAAFLLVCGEFLPGARGP